MSDKELTPAERKALYKRQDAAMARKIKRIEAEEKARLDEVKALAAACALRERLLSDYAYEMFCLLKWWQSGQVTKDVCDRRDRVIEIFS